VRVVNALAPVFHPVFLGKVTSAFSVRRSAFGVTPSFVPALRAAGLQTQRALGSRRSFLSCARNGRAKPGRDASPRRPQGQVATQEPAAGSGTPPYPDDAAGWSNTSTWGQEESQIFFSRQDPKTPRGSITIASLGLLGVHPSTRCASIRRWGDQGSCGGAV